MLEGFSFASNERVWLGHLKCVVPSCPEEYGFEGASVDKIKVAIIYESASSVAYVARMAGYGEIIAQDHDMKSEFSDFCIFHEGTIILNLVCSQGGRRTSNVTENDCSRLKDQLSSLPNLKVMLMLANLRKPVCQAT